MPRVDDQNVWLELIIPCRSATPFTDADEAALSFVFGDDEPGREYEKGTPLKDFFATDVAGVRHFGSGEVAEILNLEPWQLHRVLGRYPLTSSRQLGRGRGSRRWFTTEDIYRIATALFLVEDGFGSKIVSSIVQTLEDEDFYGTHNERGEFSEMGVLLKRTSKGRQAVAFRLNTPPEIRLGGPIYYALALNQITQMIDRRIKEVDEKRRT